MTHNTDRLAINNFIMQKDTNRCISNKVHLLEEFSWVP